MTHDVTIAANDGEGNTTTHDITLTAVQFETSPLRGRLLLSEVTFEGTRLFPLDEFVELAVRSNEEIDLTGVTITDINPLFANTSDSSDFTFTFPNGRLDGSTDDRAVVWIDRTSRDAANAPAIEFEGGNTTAWNAGIPALNIDGDEVFLLDADGNLIDYVAWGSTGGGSERNEAPTADATIWDSTAETQLANVVVNSGHSISRASHADAALATSICWERTGTGDAAAAGCVGATTTVDLDDRYSRIGNVGLPEF